MRQLELNKLQDLSSSWTARNVASVLISLKGTSVEVMKGN